MVPDQPFGMQRLNGHELPSASKTLVLAGHVDDERQVEIDQDTERMAILPIKHEVTITDITVIDPQLEQTFMTCYVCKKSGQGGTEQTHSEGNPRPPANTLLLPVA